MEIEDEIFCGKHPTQRLTNRLRGNVGHCSRCGLFVRALGAPEIERDIPRPAPANVRKRAAEIIGGGEVRKSEKASRRGDRRADGDGAIPAKAMLAGVDCATVRRDPISKATRSDGCRDL